MIKGFNKFNQKDQEKLFWFIVAQIVIIIFVSFFIPYIIIESKTFIKDGLTSLALVIDKRNYEEDTTFDYKLKYIVDNGDTLTTRLTSELDFDLGEELIVYYSKTNNFHVREFDKVNSYKKSLVILILVWLLEFGLLLLATIKPETAIKLIKGELSLIKTGHNNGEHS